MASFFSFFHFSKRERIVQYKSTLPTLDQGGRCLDSMASAQVTAVHVLDCTRSPKSLNPCPSHILWYTEEPLRDLSAFQRDVVYVCRVHPRVLQINGVKLKDINTIDACDSSAECFCKTIYLVELRRNFGSERNHWPQCLVRPDWSCISSPEPGTAPTWYKEEPGLILFFFKHS